MHTYILQHRVCVSRLPLLHPLLLVHQGVFPRNDGIQGRGFNSVASELYISRITFYRENIMYMQLL